MGQRCRCQNQHCHYCVQTSSGDTCRTCRDGWYLLDGECLESCPSELTSLGIGGFGRRCMGELTCSRNRIVDQGDLPYGCRCPGEGNIAAGYCQTCAFNAGGNGEDCQRCTGNKFL